MASLHDRFTVPRWLVLASVLVGMILLSRPVEVNAQAEPAPAAAAAPQAPAAHAPKSTLAWIIETSGWIGAFLLVISIFFIATVMRLFIELREPIVMPPELIQECEALLVKRDYNAIYRLAKDSSSELGQLIATGMAALSSGLSDAREAIDRLGEAMTVEMEKRISMLAVVGTLGPLIGLLGTLKGMIASFSVIATSDTGMKASEVAAGISEALILTFEGVFLSVPAIYFFAVFKNRVSSLSVQSVNLADDFVRRVHNAAHKKAAEPTA